MRPERACRAVHAAVPAGDPGWFRQGNPADIDIALGAISGSSIANTVSTGSLTIPDMPRAGTVGRRPVRTAPARLSPDTAPV